MTDEFPIAGVLDALDAAPRKSHGAGRAIMFIAAQRGLGVTTAVRTLAEAIGPGAVFAVDLDLYGNALAKLLAETGELGPRIDGALSGHLFYSIVGANGRIIPDAAPSYFFHRVGRARLYVGAYHARELSRGARIMVSAASDYWDAARAGGATVVVDAPALERSQVGLRVAQHMDGVVLVVGDGPGAAPAATAAKAQLEAAGANLLGLVYSGATAPVMAVERLLSQVT